MNNLEDKEQKELLDLQEEIYHIDDWKNPALKPKKLTKKRDFVEKFQKCFTTKDREILLDPFYPFVEKKTPIDLLYVAYVHWKKDIEGVKE